VLIGGTVLGVFAHVLNMRDAGSHWRRNGVTDNPFAWGAIAIGVALIVAALYLPGLANALGTVEPGAAGWLLVAGGSLLPLVIGQAIKSRLWHLGLGGRETSPATH
jgi:Ca2+-transporting ATPase